MPQFTEAARTQILTYLGQAEDALALRVRVRRPSPIAPEYELLVVEEGDQEPGDTVLDAGGFQVFIDPASVPLLAGARVDWGERQGETGFSFHAPDPPRGGEPPAGTLLERVRWVIRERVNPGLASHGGQVQLEALRDGVAYLRMGGGCQGCSLADVTLQQGIRRILLDAVPDLAEVQDMTDHAAGATPYL